MRYRNRTTSVCLLRACIDSDGTVLCIQVVESLDSKFNDLKTTIACMHAELAKSCDMPSLAGQRGAALSDQLVSAAASRHGRRWRSLICAVTRNEWHLREWLLRNLYIGISHIVLIDDNHGPNNHLSKDVDISSVVKPLVDLGLVSHVLPSQRCGDNCEKSWDDVHKLTRQCVREHANLTDWLLLADTDEYVYAEYNGVARDALSNALGDLEREGYHGALVPWSMMYGEQLTLESQIDADGGLMRAFPRVLSAAQVTKPVGMPAHMGFRPPHRFSGCRHGKLRCAWRNARVCRDGVCSIGGGHGRIALLHYFQKTVENFLAKRDISLPHQRQRAARPSAAGAGAEPSGIRSLCAMYDDGRFGQARDCRQLRRFPLATSYLHDVGRLLRATAAWGEAGRTLRAPPRRSEAQPGATSNVHDLFRGAVASGRAFSPERYEKAISIDPKRHCDAMQHFLAACCARDNESRSGVLSRSSEWLTHPR